MTRIPSLLTLIIAVVLAVLGGRAITSQDTGPDKYTVQGPGGLAFSEFRIRTLAGRLHQPDREQVMAVILANPLMIDAYQAGIPGNRKPFPDGSDGEDPLGSEKAGDVPHGDVRARCMTSTSW